MSTPDYQQVLRDIEANAKDNRWPIIGPDKGQILVDLVREHKPRRILEIGALVGYSSTLMAANLEEGGRIVSIEVDPAHAELTRDTQQRAGVADRCEVVVGNALELIPTLDGPWDMVFIDAEKSEYLGYLQAAEPKLSPNAIVVADNVKIAADAVTSYLEYVRNSERYESSYHDFERDAVEVSRLR